MMLAAEFGTGQVLWSIFWFFLFFMWIWLVVSVLGDVFTSSDLSGWAKALWSLFIIFLPFLGVFAYLIARGDKMTEKSIERAGEQEQAMRSYIQETAGGTSTADELAKLADLNANGTLSDTEYAAAKAKLLS